MLFFSATLMDASSSQIRFLKQKSEKSFTKIRYISLDNVKKVSTAYMYLPSLQSPSSVNRMLAPYTKKIKTENGWGRISCAGKANNVTLDIESTQCPPL